MLHAYGVSVRLRCALTDSPYAETWGPQHPPHNAASGVTSGRRLLKSRKCTGPHHPWLQVLCRLPQLPSRSCHIQLHRARNVKCAASESLHHEVWALTIMVYEASPSGCRIAGCNTKRAGLPALLPEAQFLHLLQYSPSKPLPESFSASASLSFRSAAI